MMAREGPAANARSSSSSRSGSSSPFDTRSRSSKAKVDRKPAWNGAPSSSSASSRRNGIPNMKHGIRGPTAPAPHLEQRSRWPTWATWAMWASTRRRSGAMDLQDDGEVAAADLSLAWRTRALVDGGAPSMVYGAAPSFRPAASRDPMPFPHPPFRLVSRLNLVEPPYAGPQSGRALAYQLCCGRTLEAGCTSKK